jgi:hypothetical protein
MTIDRKSINHQTNLSLAKFWNPEQYRIVFASQKFAKDVNQTIRNWGMTHAEVTLRYGIQIGTVRKVASGHFDSLNVNTFMKFCYYLDLDANEYFTEELRSDECTSIKREVQ